MSKDTGTGSALGWINLTTCDSPGASLRLLVPPFALRRPEGRHPTNPIRNGFNPTVGDGATVPPREEQTRVLNWRFSVLNASNAESSLQGGQPSGNDPVCQGISGCVRTCQCRRTPPPAACPNVPSGIPFVPGWAQSDLRGLANAATASDSYRLGESPVDIESKESRLTIRTRPSRSRSRRAWTSSTSDSEHIPHSMERRRSLASRRLASRRVRPEPASMGRPRSTRRWIRRAMEAW